MNFKNCLLGLLLCPAANAFAQNINALSLGIGDTMPNLTFTVYKYPRSKIQLSELRGKAIIFDFVSTWCASCLKALPHLNELQRTNQDSLEIFIVSAEPIARLEKIFRAAGLNLTYLSIIASDSLLDKLFPHTILPHTVWINPQGVAAAFTGAAEVQQETVSALISARPLDLPVKADLLDFDPQKPLADNLAEAGIPPANKFQTTISGFLPGVGSFSSVQKSAQFIRLLYVNQSVQNLYIAALGIRVTDTASLEWLARKENSTHTSPSGRSLFCYEIVSNANPDLKASKAKMLEDLNTFFGLTAKIIVSEGRIKYQVTGNTNQ